MRAASVLLLAACGLEAGSCGGRHTFLPRLAATGTAGGAPSAAGSTPLPSDAEPPRTFDFARVTAITAHPALVAARAPLAAKRWRDAADVLQRALDARALAGDDVTRARFLQGRLLTLAKDEDGAVVCYAAVPESSPLFAYAALRRAAYYVRRGRVDDAAALLPKIPDVAPLAGDRRFVLGEVLAANGDHAGAAAAFSQERRGGRWVDGSIRSGEEALLVNAVGKDADAHAREALEALRAVRRVRFEAPLSPLVGRALDVERRLRARLPQGSSPAESATPSEQLAAAQAYLDAGKVKDAISTVAAVLAGAPKGADEWCRASLLVARAYDRLRDRTKSSDAYGDTAASCPAEAVVVPALYEGARVALTLHQGPLARSRFAALESAAPNHRLADDARLRGALAAIDAGEVERGEAMLAALPDDYPAGDMRAEALFQLALPRMKRGDWAAAVSHLERSLALVPHEDGYFAAGRAAYFLGRAKLETGLVADGIACLREVIAQEPLSFAAVMAYARLAGRSPAEHALAKQTLDDALAAEPGGALLPAWRAELGSPAFARGVELARVLDVDAARRELQVAGLLGDPTTDPEGSWVVAALLGRVGDARASHAIARGRVTEWQRHFPSGRWRDAWEIAFPRPYPELVAMASAKQGVPRALLWAVMREESAFDPDAVSSSNAYGLLQLILPTARRYATPLMLESDTRALTRPEVSIALGAAYLKKLRAEFSDNVALAVPSYNAGEGATRRWRSPPLADSFDLWVESIPYEETRRYTKRVLGTYYAYVALYDPAALDAELASALGVRPP